MMSIKNIDLVCYSEQEAPNSHSNSTFPQKKATEAVLG